MIKDMAIGAGISMVGSMLGTASQVSQRNKQIRAKRKAARFKYGALESSINITKSIDREASLNAVGEVLRVGAEKNRNVEGAIQEVASSQIARQEGITAGRSRGRAMVTTMIKGNKKLQETKNESTNMINNITEQLDKKTHDLNMKLINAHSELTAILSDTGPEIDGTANALAAGISGAAQGAAMSGMFGKTSTPTPNSHHANPALQPMRGGV